MPTPLILLIDHDDSFTYNIAQAFQALGFFVEILNHRRSTVSEVNNIDPSAIVLGPGPGHPADATLALSLCRTVSPTLPILGICLGHQILGLYCGAQITRARVPLHGHPVSIQHNKKDLFLNLSQNCLMVRYNSLEVVVPSLECLDLEISARSPDGAIMALQHLKRPWYGVQFHPESIGSTEGFRLLENFGRKISHWNRNKIHSLPRGEPLFAS